MFLDNRSTIGVNMLKYFLLTALSVTTLYAQTNVVAFSGSTRKESINKKLIAEAANFAKDAGANVTVIDLKDYPIPFFDEDLEKQGMPEKAKEIRKLMMESQVVIIATPEYNGSISGVLKNVIDWTTRTERGEPSRDAYKGKKFILLSASPGQSAGATALAHLKSIVQRIGGTVVYEYALPNSFDAFDANGHLKDQQSTHNLKQAVQNAVK